MLRFAKCTDFAQYVLLDLALTSRLCPIRRVPVNTQCKSNPTLHSLSLCHTACVYQMAISHPHIWSGSSGWRRHCSVLPGNKGGSWPQRCKCIDERIATACATVSSTRVSRASSNAMDIVLLFVCVCRSISPKVKSTANAKQKKASGRLDYNNCEAN